MIEIITSKETDKNHIPFFKINNRVEVFLTNSENEQIVDTYSSRIENITENGMSIAMPMSKGFPIMLRPNEMFVGRMPLAEAAYEFTCVYFDKVLEPLLLWQVSLPYNIVRSQQRQFVRYDFSMPVTLEVFDPKNKQDLGKLFAMRTKDISAGGFKVISKVPFASDTLANLTFDIPHYGEITASSRVVRIEKPQKDLPVFLVAFQFVDIAPKERDAIVQFIFKKQLEDRRKFSEFNRK